MIRRTMEYTGIPKVDTLRMQSTGLRVYPSVFLDQILREMSCKIILQWLQQEKEVIRLDTARTGQFGILLLQVCFQREPITSPGMEKYG